MSYALSFNGAVSISFNGNEEATIDTPYETITLSNIGPGVHKVLEALRDRWITGEDAFDIISRLDDEDAARQFMEYLEHLSEGKLLCYSVVDNEQIMARCRPCSLSFNMVTGISLPAESLFMLSRFAHMRSDSGLMLCESPLAHCRIEIMDARIMPVFHMLIRPRGISEISQSLGFPSEPVIILLLTMLMSQEFVHEVKAGEINESEALRQWEFHDLLFHARSRIGRHGYPLGRTMRFLNRIPPLPIVKPAMSKTFIDLFKPDIQSLKDTDVSFTKVLEDRKTVYDCSPDPITIEQLGEFLYRSARLKKLSGGEVAPGISQEYGFSNHPTGGALQELELYVMAGKCKGLNPAFYHYHSEQHRLYLVSEATGACTGLMESASRSTATKYDPQVLLVITTRFQRTSWKYESIAYSLVLKDVGVLMQTMYLVATAMGLAPCALGCGNSEDFAAATGLDYCEETSVGEFMLASRTNPEAMS